MAVGFLSPIFLAALAAVAVPIALHLMRRQADPIVPFPALRLIRRAPVAEAKRRRLRELLLLLLRCAALALLALSFARPYFAPGVAASQAPLTIVAVDTSYSLSAPGQIERTRAVAREVADAAPSGGPVAVIAFDDGARLVVPPTLDRSAVRGAIARLAPRPRATRYRAVLAASAELAAPSGARLVIVSDLQQRGWNDQGGGAAPSGMTIEARDAGHAEGNLGISGLRRTTEGVAVGVASTWASSRTTRLRVRLGGRTLADVPVTMTAGSTREIAVPVRLPASGGLEAAIDDPGGLPPDDRRYLVLDAAPRARVLIVTAPGAATSAFFLERALMAAEGDAGMAIDRATTAELAAKAASGGYAAIVLLGGGGLDRRGADALAGAVDAGAGLLAVAGPGIDGRRLASILPASLGVSIGEAASADDAVVLTAADPRHPLFRALEGEPGLLGSARFVRFARLEADASRVLARFSNGAPAIVEASRDRGGRVLVLASDVGNVWNDLALHPVFVPFAHGLVRYLADNGATRTSYLVGELAGPAGSEPGLIDVPAAASRGATRPVAVNVDATEADPARMSAASFVQAVPRSHEPMRAAGVNDRRAREREQSLWRYGLMLMLAALVVESAIGRRA